MGVMDTVVAPASSAPLLDSSVDGRFQRSQRTRLLVLDAFLDLLDEGDLAPTAQRTAERSSVSLRTVFHHFNDMETIHELAGQRMIRRIAAQTRKVPTSGTLARRIDAFIENRIAVNQMMHNVSSAARLREPFSPTLQRNRDYLLRLGDREIRAVFSRELAPMPASAQDALVAAVALVSNWGSWYSLTEELGVQAAPAGEILRASLRALLGSRTAFLNQAG